MVKFACRTFREINNNLCCLFFLPHILKILKRLFIKGKLVLFSLHCFKPITCLYVTDYFHLPAVYIIVYGGFFFKVIVFFFNCLTSDSGILLFCVYSPLMLLILYLHCIIYQIYSFSVCSLVLICLLIELSHCK